MPELPDVEGFRHAVERHVVRHRIRTVEVLDATVLRNATADDVVCVVTGRVCTGTLRTGKWLSVLLDKPRSEGPSLVVHFGMTGSLSWSTEGIRHRHDRFLIGVDGGELRYRDQRKLGGVWFLPEGGAITNVSGPQGPDALGLRLDSLSAVLGVRRSVKVVLMDQSVVAGLGNMSSDEVLWRSRIHPDRPANSLDDEDVARLHAAMNTTMRGAVRAGHIPRTPRWLTGQRARPDPHCPRCGTGLQWTRVGGRSSLAGAPSARSSVCPSRTANLPSN